VPELPDALPAEYVSVDDKNRTYNGVILGVTRLGFVEDVRSHNIIPRRQIKKAARDFAAAASDERYRETFENIRLLRDRFEPEAGRRASLAP
jgi:hypothetical protein